MGILCSNFRWATAFGKPLSLNSLNSWNLGVVFKRVNNLNIGSNQGSLSSGLCRPPKESASTARSQHETGWDLGPGTFCRSACTWTNISSSQQNVTKTLWRTKNSCVHVQLGQTVSNRIQKDQKPTCRFWKIRSKSKVHCISPALAATKGVGKLPRLPL